MAELGDRRLIAFEAMPDEQVVKHAKRGSRSATQHLLSKYRSLVEGKAKSYFLIGAEHDDVVQEGMIGLFKAVRDFDPTRGASFRTFASQCVTAQIRNAVRDAGREKHRLLTDSLSLYGITDTGGEEANGLPGAVPASDEADPERRLIFAETTQDVQDFMETELTVLERSAIRLLLAHFSYQEAAERLGRDVKSIDNAVRRARVKFNDRFRRPPREVDNHTPV